jgi:hypothetical protein
LPPTDRFFYHNWAKRQAIISVSYHTQHNKSTPFIRCWSISCCYTRWRAYAISFPLFWCFSFESCKNLCLLPNSETK